MLFSHRPERPHRASRRSAFAALTAFATALLLAVQTSAGAPGNSVAIVSNLGGALTVRDASGVSHDVSGAQPLRSGDTVMTGINALASISLAGTLRARLGAGTVAQYYAQNAAPALRLSAGALCVAENTAGVTVAAAGTALTAVNTPAVFDIVTGHSGTTIVLYAGSVAAVASGSKSSMVQAPAAFAAVPGGQFTASPFDATAASIASMPCPDRDSARKTLAALPSPSPSPESTVASSSGGGGGGGGVLGILAGIVGLAALAGHGGGGGGGGGNPPPVPSPSPGTLQVSPTSLTFSVGGSTQTVNASEAQYGGPLTASSPNPAVATVSPASALSPATFTVTPVGPGTTMFSISDNHGSSVPVSVTVSAPGALTVSPLNFQTQPINAGPLPLTVSESKYVGPFTVTSDHPNIVGISGGGNGPTPPPFFVTPAGTAGNAKITVTDTLHNKVVVPITIAGPIVDNPPVLNAITAPTTFTSTDAFYTGSLSASSDKETVATVTGGGPGPGPVTFTVTPHVQGNANITVVDALGQKGVVPVSVSTGGLVLNPNSLMFSNPSGETHKFNATEPNYNGHITPSGCPSNIVTVTPTVGQGPSQDFTVKSVGPGNCVMMVVTGDNSANEQITVFGNLVVSPPTLTFTDVNVMLPVSVSELNYNGPFTISANDCAGIADVGQPSSGGPNATINVTSSVSLNGGTCSFQVDDNHGGAQPVNVIVGPFGSPAPSPASLTLNTVNETSGSISVSETGYTGQFTPTSSDCTGIATFSPSQGTIFTIDETGAGTCHILFSDDHGGSTSATIVVDGALVLAPNPIDFTDINIISPASIDEPNYTGNFTIAVDNCTGGVATIGAPAGPGPSTTVNVTSVAQGQCTFAVQDTDGQSVTETVNVGPFGPPIPSTAQLNLNAGNLSGTFTISESGYTGDFTLTPSSACAGIASVAPGSGNQSTTFTVTATGTVGTCGIRIADDVGQMANVEVEVAGGSMSVNPAALSFASESSPEQDVFASDAGATGFTCVSSDPTDLSATISSQSTGSATCAVTPMNTSFVGTTQVTFGDDLGSSAIVQVGIGVQPLSNHHHATPGGVKRPMPAPRGSHPPVVPGRPLPIPNANQIELSSAQLTLPAVNGRQTITANVGNYVGALTATSSAPNIVDVSVLPSNGPVRSISITAKAPGTATVRIADDHGDSSYVRVLVVGAALNRPGPGSNTHPGGPPNDMRNEQRADRR